MIVRIQSKRDGYRRCGIAHPRLPTDHPAERFTEAMLEKLQADPVLTVELLDGEAPGASPEAGQAATGQGGEPTKAPAKPAAQAKPDKANAAKPGKTGGSAKAATKAPAKPAAKPAAPAAPATAPQPAAQEGQQQEQQGGEA